jgi:hypothetical protein
MHDAGDRHWRCDLIDVVQVAHHVRNGELEPVEFFFREPLLYVQF